jgi:hypothetical protein
MMIAGVLTYPNSPDYRPDIDHLSPVQVRLDPNQILYANAESAAC